jgi:hypothetical protein
MRVRIRAILSVILASFATTLAVDASAFVTPHRQREVPMHAVIVGVWNVVFEELQKDPVTFVIEPGRVTVRVESSGDVREYDYLYEVVREDARTLSMSLIVLGTRLPPYVLERDAASSDLLLEGGGHHHTRLVRLP